MTVEGTKRFLFMSLHSAPTGRMVVCEVKISIYDTNILMKVVGDVRVLTELVS